MAEIERCRFKALWLEYMALIGLPDVMGDDKRLGLRTNADVVVFIDKV